MENLAEVEQWRARQEDPANNPSSMWRNYQKSASQRDKRDAARKPNRLQEVVIEQREHIAELEATIEVLRDENQRLSRRTRGR